MGILVAVGIVGCLSLIYLMPHRQRGHPAPTDSTWLRGIHQAMVVWSQNNRDWLPTPSMIDVANTTVREQGPAKDSTANILSILVWNGSIPTEGLVSPLEANPKIRVCDTYEFDQPKAAVDPAKALWDPALSADFTAPEGGNISFAHLLPSGPRMATWSYHRTGPLPLRAIIGNRGPEISAATAGPGNTVTPVFVNPKSLTFLIHGKPDRWEGNVAFTDNHVDYLTKPHAADYTTASGVTRKDLLFFDEPDDPKGTNDFLGIFPKAGPTPKDFRAIWD